MSIDQHLMQCQSAMPTAMGTLHEHSPLYRLTLINIGLPVVSYRSPPKHERNERVGSSWFNDGVIEQRYRETDRTSGIDIRTNCLCVSKLASPSTPALLRDPFYFDRFCMICIHRIMHVCSTIVDVPRTSIYGWEASLNLTIYFAPQSTLICFNPSSHYTDIIISCSAIAYIKDPR